MPLNDDGIDRNDRMKKIIMIRFETLDPRKLKERNEGCLSKPSIVSLRLL